MTALTTRQSLAGPTDAATRRALLACLRQDPGESGRQAIQSMDADGWARLLEAVKRQRVAGMVRHRLKEHGLGGAIPAEVAAALEEITRKAARRVLQLHAELAVILERFAALDIPVILLKGAHLATAVYGNLALRDMGDLDLLVPAERLASAAALVRELGYIPVRPSSVDVDRQTSHHLTRSVKPRVGAVEIHWNLTDPDCQQSIDPAELWQRAVTVRIAGWEVRALSPNDEILHLCVHTSYLHLFGFGLRSLCDIAMLAAVPDSNLEWTTITQRAAAWKWGRGVFLTLRLARDLLGVTVPAQVLDTLRPAGFEDALLTLAEDQLFADPADVKELGEISKLAGSQTLARRLRHVKERVFLGPLALASLHNRPVAMSRREQLLWYPVRLWDLIRRHGPTAVRFWIERGSPFTATAEGQDKLRAWLAGA